MINLSGTTIQITKEDIENAKQVRRDFDERKTNCYSRSETCPLAFALKRVYGEEFVIMPWSISRKLMDNPRREIPFPIRVYSNIYQFITRADKEVDNIEPQEITF